MSLDRNAIFDALFNLVTASPGFVTKGQRFRRWGDVPAQPALFLRFPEEMYPKREARMSRVSLILEGEVWIYYKTSEPDEAPIRKLNELVTAVEEALRPSVVTGVQNLGLSFVSHCWIEGTVIKEDGALTGQALAMIPIKILAIS